MESDDSVRSGRDNPKTSQRILYVGFVFFFLLLDFQTWDIFIQAPFMALCGIADGEHSVRATSRESRSIEGRARRSGYSSYDRSV